MNQLFISLKDIRSYFYLLTFVVSSTPLAQASVHSSDPNPGSEVQFEDIRVPSYKIHRPQWGLEFTSSLQAFGGQALVVEQGTNPLYAFSLSAEYQPAFLQNFGVFGIGPTFTVYPAFGSTMTYGFLALLGTGAQIRYQARYFRDQPLVPVFAYSIESFSYQFNSGKTGTLISQGPSLGLWIFLNFLEFSSAAQIYMNHGVSRSYLTLEYRILAGQDANLNFSGGSYYFGLRLEL